MYILNKIIQSVRITKHLSPIIKRNLNKNPEKKFRKQTFFLILTGIGLTCYYYLSIIPKWTNPQPQQLPILNRDDLQLQLESNIYQENAQTAKEKFNFIDKVVQKCAPGVFHILITTTKPKVPDNGEISPFVYGSGFVIREDGWAITNAHVVLNKDSYISCKMSDGTLYTAEVVDMDVNIDVALLKLHTRANTPLTALNLEQPGIVSVGEWVVALGSPLSLSNSISVGVVSSINRSAKELGLKNYSMSYIQTDALITFGNSGGPLVNLEGNVIGISSLRLTSGISFAIPVEFCVKFLQNCKAFNPGTVRNKNVDNDEELTLFGLTTISMTSDVLLDLVQKELMGMPKDIKEGLLIWKVLDGSAAEECGLDAGDVITHINGVPVKYAKDLYGKSDLECDSVQLTIIKQSGQEEITISLPVNKISRDSYRS